MTGEEHAGRTILALGGSERVSFLQKIVTTDLGRLADGLVYTALLTPQGKYLADFFLKDDGDRLLVDVATPLAADLAKRLKMYKLRADVTLDETDLHAVRGLGEPPAGALPDPRHPALGWRRYTAEPGEPPGTDWEALRVAHCIPESGVELIPNESFILEAGLDRLNGVDFRKGCFVGQEVVARMKHKTTLRKGLVTVAVSGAAPPPGTAIMAGEKTAGTLHTVAGDRGIAHLRFDRAGADMQAGEARVDWTPAETPG
ncbi:MAG: folate-binding protein [Alphaproteobacteria bacterium]|jgi:folate-binding protein YgfZ|nr:folate-binding protein [Alphaproteobacteria bacterium]